MEEVFEGVESHPRSGGSGFLWDTNGCLDGTSLTNQYCTKRVPRGRSDSQGTQTQKSRSCLDPIPKRVRPGVKSRYDNSRDKKKDNEDETSLHEDPFMVGLLKYVPEFLTFSPTIPNLQIRED